MIANEQNTQLNVDPGTLAQASRIAMQQDKPIMLDYYAASVNKAGARIVRTNEGENILYKSDSEFTSPLKRVFKMGNDIIALSNNSISIVHHSML